jgi:hypothetical protein
MSRRLTHFVNAVQALYGGSESWFVGRSHIHAHEDATDRIVVVGTTGPIVEADTAAQGWEHSELALRIVETTGRRDDIVRLRRLSVDFYLWAPDEDTAESRLHSLIIAVDSVDNVEIVGERWPQEEEQDIASGGAMVVLTVVVPIAVVESDADPAVTPGGDDYGQSQVSPVVTIVADLDGDELPPVTIAPDP